jgi:N,N'-diacetyllegionaminate synthase
MTTLIIGEAGVNHNGDIKIAKELIDRAVDSGVDIVKFQTFKADRLATKTAEKASYQLATTPNEETHFEMLRKLELSHEMHKELIDHCRSNGVEFLSSGFDIASLDYLAGLEHKRFKIPSGEITNLPYLRHIGKFGEPIILSTGMATMQEIGAAIEILERAGTPREQLTVLHCTTEYPAPMGEVNLLAMQRIKDTYQVEVGYSDHTVGIEVAVAAVALGASVIEKHFTLDRSLPGPDHKASLEPDELKAMVSAIRNIEQALGNGNKVVTQSELLNIPIARKSLVAMVSISRGELFSASNIDAKRPGTGISPMKIDEVIGQSAKRDFIEGELIEL